MSALRLLHSLCERARVGSPCCRMRVLVNDRSCCMCKVRHAKGRQRDWLLWVRHNSLLSCVQEEQETPVITADRTRDYDSFNVRTVVPGMCRCVSGLLVAAAIQTYGRHGGPDMRFDEGSECFIHDPTHTHYDELLQLRSFDCPVDGCAHKVGGGGGSTGGCACVVVSFTCTTVVVAVRKPGSSQETPYFSQAIPLRAVSGEPTLVHPRAAHVLGRRACAALA